MKIFSSFLLSLSLISGEAQASFDAMKSWINEQRVEKLQKVNTDELAQILTTCEKIWKLKESLGLTEEELFDIVLYIETEMKSEIEQGKFYLRKEDTGLCRSLEYDPISKLTFIHLKSHGINPLGKGKYKRVTVSINYDKDSPELAANCILVDDGTERVSKSIAHELTVAKTVPNAEGLAQTLAITEHSKRDASKALCFMQKLYCGGSLKRYCLEKAHPYNEDMLFLARDFVVGLEALHQHDLVHGDLHGGNLMLHKKTDPCTDRERIFGVIIDFGHTQSPITAAQRRPRVEAGGRFNAPEAFAPMEEEIDAKAIDVYALGMSLYDLYYGQAAEWALKERFKGSSNMDAMQKAENRQLLVTDLAKYRQMRLDTLKNDGSAEDEFAKLILQMIHEDPKARGTAHQVRKKMDYLIIRNEIDHLIERLSCRLSDELPEIVTSNYLQLVALANKSP